MDCRKVVLTGGRKKERGVLPSWAACRTINSLTSRFRCRLLLQMCLLNTLCVAGQRFRSLCRCFQKVSCGSFVRLFLLGILVGFILSSLFKCSSCLFQELFCHRLRPLVCSLTVLCVLSIWSTLTSFFQFCADGSMICDTVEVLVSSAFPHCYVSWRRQCCEANAKSICAGAPPVRRMTSVHPFVVIYVLPCIASHQAFFLHEVDQQALSLVLVVNVLCPPQPSLSSPNPALLPGPRLLSMPNSTPSRRLVRKTACTSDTVSV